MCFQNCQCHWDILSHIFHILFYSIFLKLQYFLIFFFLNFTEKPIIGFNTLHNNILKIQYNIHTLPFESCVRKKYLTEINTFIQRVHIKLINIISKECTILQKILFQINVLL